MNFVHILLYLSVLVVLLAHEAYYAAASQSNSGSGQSRNFHKKMIQKSPLSPLKDKATIVPRRLRSQKNIGGENFRRIRLSSSLQDRVVPSSNLLKATILPSPLPRDSSSPSFDHTSSGSKPVYEPLTLSNPDKTPTFQSLFTSDDSSPSSIDPIKSFFAEEKGRSAATSHGIRGYDQYDGIENDDGLNLMENIFLDGPLTFTAGQSKAEKYFSDEFKARNMPTCSGSAFCADIVSRGTLKDQISPSLSIEKQSTESSSNIVLDSDPFVQTTVSTTGSSVSSRDSSRQSSDTRSTQHMSEINRESVADPVLPQKKKRGRSSEQLRSPDPIESPVEKKANTQDIWKGLDEGVTMSASMTSASDRSILTTESGCTDSSTSSSSSSSSSVSPTEKGWRFIIKQTFEEFILKKLEIHDSTGIYYLAMRTSPPDFDDRSKLFFKFYHVCADCQREATFYQKMKESKLPYLPIDPFGESINYYEAYLSSSNVEGKLMNGLVILPYFECTLSQLLYYYNSLGRTMPILLRDIIFFRLSLAIHRLHSLQIAHRNICPETILLKLPEQTPEFIKEIDDRETLLKKPSHLSYYLQSVQLFLIDFGKATSRTIPEQMLLPPVPYTQFSETSPEDYLNSNVYTFSSDIWQLGQTLIRMTLGLSIIPKSIDSPGYRFYLLTRAFDFYVCETDFSIQSYSKDVSNLRSMNPAIFDNLMEIGRTFWPFEALKLDPSSFISLRRQSFQSNLFVYDFKPSEMPRAMTKLLLSFPMDVQQTIISLFKLTPWERITIGSLLASNIFNHLIPAAS